MSIENAPLSIIFSPVSGYGLFPMMENPSIAPVGVANTTVTVWMCARFGLINSHQTGRLILFSAKP